MDHLAGLYIGRTGNSSDEDDDGVVESRALVSRYRFAKTRTRNAAFGEIKKQLVPALLTLRASATFPAFPFRLALCLFLSLVLAFSLSLPFSSGVSPTLRPFDDGI